MKSTIFIAVLAFVSVGMYSCKSSVKKQVEEEKVEHQVYEKSSGTELATCNHSSKIFWEGTKPGGAHNGIVMLKEGGKFLVEAGRLVGGELIIDMQSIVNLDLEDEAINQKLVGHLKSADFFMVDSFPEAKFVIATVEPIKGDEQFNSKVQGNLTIKGITHSISFKANVSVVDGKVSAESDDIVLDRTKWNVNYQSKSIVKELKDKFIDDDFTIKVKVYSM